MGMLVLIGSLFMLTGCSREAAQEDVETPDPRSAVPTEEPVQDVPTPVSEPEPEPESDEGAEPEADSAAEEGSDGQEPSAEEEGEPVLSVEPDVPAPTPPPAPTATPVPKYRYEDVPDTLEGQVELQNQLREELKQAKADHVVLRRELIEKSTEMSTLQQNIDSLSSLERELIEQRPDMQELIREKEEKYELYESLGRSLTEAEAGLEEKDLTDAEANALQGEIFKLQNQRQDAVKQLAINGKKRKVRVAKLRAENSEIAALHAQWREMKDSLEQKITSEPAYLQSRKELSDLQSKMNYVSRVVIDNSR